MSLKFIPFEQPIGRFLLTVMNGEEIIRISRVDPRQFDPISLRSKGGIQRVVSEARVAEIAEYARTADATFPTPILLSIAESHCTYQQDSSVDISGEGIADIVDGQHRVRGLELSGRAKEFDIPVVFIIDPSEEQKALMFATINGKQTKVPASLIYDLFGVTEKRSPQKTAHELARALNSMPDSPWFRRLKMLGNKTPGSTESLSQGTFIKQLLPMISDNPVEDMDRIKKGLKPNIYPNCIFNSYWINDKDSTILKILINVFNAARITWKSEWDDYMSSILTKSVGFTGIMSALPGMYKYGSSKHDLSINCFTEIFGKTKQKLEVSKSTLTSDFFAGGAGAIKFRKIILESLQDS